MEPVSSFRTFPDSARLWIFSAVDSLDSAQAAMLESELNRFFSSWHSHKEPVSGTGVFYLERFLMICADQSKMQVSGCSTDSLFHAAHEAIAHNGGKVANFGDIFFRAGNEVRRMSRDDFQRHVSSGQITAETLVFDTSLQSLAQFRAGKFELPFSQSWHAALFPLNSKRLV